MTGRMPEYMSDEMSENMSDRMPDRLPDRMPGGMSGYMPDRMPEYMPEYMSDRMSEYTKYMSKYTSWHVMVGITRSRVISLFSSYFSPLFFWIVPGCVAKGSCFTLGVCSWDVFARRCFYVRNVCNRPRASEVRARWASSAKAVTFGDFNVA